MEDAYDDQNRINCMTFLFADAPVAVVPPTKRVLEDDGEQEEECLKKSRPSEESAPLSQEQVSA